MKIARIFSSRYSLNSSHFKWIAQYRNNNVHHCLACDKCKELINKSLQIYSLSRKEKREKEKQNYIILLSNENESDESMDVVMRTHNIEINDIGLFGAANNT